MSGAACHRPTVGEGGTRSGQTLASNNGGAPSLALALTVRALQCRDLEDSAERRQKTGNSSTRHNQPTKARRRIRDPRSRGAP